MKVLLVYFPQMKNLFILTLKQQSVMLVSLKVTYGIHVN